MASPGTQQTHQAHEGQIKSNNDSYYINVACRVSVVYPVHLM